MRAVLSWAGLAVLVAPNLFAVSSAQGTTYGFVDLTPSGFVQVEAYGVSDGQAVGYGRGASTSFSFHAQLWSGTAASAVDLNPAGFTYSWAVGVSGSQQVGYGSGSSTGGIGNNHALLWSGTAASAVDLNPAGITQSFAQGISDGQPFHIEFTGLHRDHHDLPNLVNHVVPAADLDATAMAMAERLAAGAPLAIRYTKLAVNKLVKDALNIAFDTSTAYELVTFHSEDHQEALAAIREKRPPVFKGR